MDKGMKIYAGVLLSIVLLILFSVFYQPGNIRELNALLAADEKLSAYPYPFRVLKVDGRVVEMSSPRSFDMPVQNMITAIYPYLKGVSPEDSSYQKAQQELADYQARAKRLILENSEIKTVQWKLDKNWLAQHGIQIVEK